LRKGGLARYNLTSVELKAIKFSARSKSLSIENAVLYPVPKRLLFAIVKDFELTGCFKHPYNLADHGSTVNGISWIDVHTDCTE